MFLPDAPCVSQHREVVARPEPRLRPLDGIRGLAILMVLGSHAFEANFEAGGRLVRVLGRTLFYGKFGVDLFFVLSGFLITRILLDTRDEPFFFRKFYARRVLRIFPLYYGVLFSLFLLTPALHLRWQGMGWLMIFDLQNLHPALVETFMVSPRIGLYHFWSLAVEEQFYLFWPAAIFLLRDRRRLFLGTVALSAAALGLRLALSTTGTAVSAIHVSLLTRADTLLLGAALAMLYRSRHWQSLSSYVPAIFCWALTMLVAAILILPEQQDLRGAPAGRAFVSNLWNQGGRYALVAFCCAALIACALRPGSVWRRLFEARVLRFFGRYSYGIYILHIFMFGILLPPLRMALRAFTQSKGLAVGGAGIVAIGLSVAVAMLSYHLVEAPCLRLKRFFDYDRNPKKLRTGTVASPSSADEWLYGARSATLKDIVEEPSFRAASTIITKSTP